MASNMFDLPDPLSPVIALKCGSNLLGSNSNDDDEKMSGKDWQGELLNKNERMIMIVFPSVVIVLSTIVSAAFLPVDGGPVSIGLESVHDNLLNVHDTYAVPLLSRFVHCIDCSLIAEVSVTG